MVSAIYFIAFLLKLVFVVELSILKLRFGKMINCNWLMNIDILHTASFAKSPSVNRV